MKEKVSLASILKPGKRRILLVLCVLLVLNSIIILLLYKQALRNDVWVQEQRIESPDGMADAVLVIADAGATTLESYRVYIVPRGDTPDERNEVFIADNVHSFDFMWASPGELNIIMKSARIFKHIENLSLGTGNEIKCIVNVFVKKMIPLQQ